MIVVFVLAETSKELLQQKIHDEAIRDYRTDINKINLVDWFQETVSYN